MAGLNTEENFIISSNGEQNLDQEAGDGEVDELNRSLSNGGAVEEDNDGDGVEVDLDELDQEESRSGRVDTELQEAHTQADRDRIKEERKQARKDRIARAKAREESLRREVASERERRIELENRLSRLENTQVGVELGQLEQAEANADAAISQLQGIIEEATIKADGKSVALASTRLAEAIAYKNQVKAVRERAETAAKRPKQAHVDPRLVENSRQWMSRNKWYKGPQANDPDSKVLTAIDNSLGAEGWDPTTPEYWTELDARAKKYLGHRYTGRPAVNETDDNPPQRDTSTPASRPRQAVAGSGNNGNGSTSVNGRNTFHLSAERVRAMKESGAWEDPKRKADQIRRYREYDAANRR